MRMNSVRERRKYIHTHIYIAHAWIRKSPPFICSLFNEITVNPLHLVNRGGPPFLWRPSKFCLSPVFDAVRAPPFCGSVYTKDGMKNCRRDRMGRLLCFCVLLRMFFFVAVVSQERGVNSFWLGKVTCRKKDQNRSHAWFWRSISISRIYCHKIPGGVNYSKPSYTSTLTMLE